MAGEERIGQRDGFDGKFIKVRVDDVRLPSGRTSTREVVEHPGAVAIVAVTTDNQILLVRQFRYAAGRELLEIPAGTREPNEDPTTTAHRELIEETVHTARAMSPVLTFFSSPGYSTEQITIFHANDCAPVAHTPDIDEPTRLERIPLTDLPTLLTNSADQIADGKTLIGLLWLLRESHTQVTGDAVRETPGPGD
jgi:ADP-ribose pyrophosphatase